MYHAPLSMLPDSFGLQVYAQDEENETQDSALAMTTESHIDISLLPKSLIDQAQIAGFTRIEPELPIGHNHWKIHIAIISHRFIKVQDQKFLSDLDLSDQSDMQNNKAKMKTTNIKRIITGRDRTEQKI